MLASTRVLAKATAARALDVLGAMTGTAGVLGLAYEISRGGEHGWADGLTPGHPRTRCPAARVAHRSAAPQREPNAAPLPARRPEPLRAYAAMLLIGAGLMGTAFLLTLDMQQVLHFSPIKTGFAYLPFSAGSILSQGVSPKLVERFAPRAVAEPGLLLAAVAMFWLSLLSPDSSDFGHVHPGVFLTVFGMGLAVAPLTASTVHDVADTLTTAHRRPRRRRRNARRGRDDLSHRHQRATTGRRRRRLQSRQIATP